MRKFNFTKERLAEYYENRFPRDLREFFMIDRVGGADYVQGFKTSMHDVFHPVSLFMTSPLFSGENDNVDNQSPKNKRSDKDEEEILFIALVSFMYASDYAIYRRAKNISIKEIASSMSAFGFLWFRSVESMDLSCFLSLYHVREDIYLKEELNAIRNAMTLVEPYMFDRLIPFLNNWDGGYFNEEIRHFETLRDYIHNSIIKGLTTFYRQKFYKYCGLTGIEFTHREFDDYYNNRFPQQLRDYFSEAKKEENYLKIIYVPFHNNCRWEDGNPGGNANDNFLFATLFLYMTLAEQSILKYTKESEADFHRCTGWPLIYSGPGAGPYLHPLRMLEYAGLSPMKYEAPLLAEMTKRIFPYLRQDMFAILNGKEGPMKDKAAGKRLNEAIKDGKSKLIKAYMETGEKDIQDMLAVWTSSPAESWSEILENQGMLKMN